MSVQVTLTVVDRVSPQSDSVRLRSLLESTVLKPGRITSNERVEVKQFRMKFNRICIDQKYITGLLLIHSTTAWQNDIQYVM